MTDRIRVKQTNRKEAMARALAMLIIGFGVLLIGAGWWVQQSTKTPTPSLNELQAIAAQPLPPTPPITQPIIAEPAPVPAALPIAANLTLQDKPEPNTQNEPPAVTVQPILPPKPEPVVKPQPAPAPVEKPQPVATPGLAVSVVRVEWIVRRNHRRRAVCHGQGVPAGCAFQRFVVFLQLGLCHFRRFDPDGRDLIAQRKPDGPGVLRCNHLYDGVAGGCLSLEERALTRRL